METKQTLTLQLHHMFVHFCLCMQLCKKKKEKKKNEPWQTQDFKGVYLSWLHAHVITPLLATKDR